MTDIGSGMGEAEIGTLVELVTAALSRNYPDMTPDQVENLLDLSNASKVLSAILTGSGLKPTGEDQARATGTISAPSMASSPPAAATDTAT